MFSFKINVRFIIKMQNCCCNKSKSFKLQQTTYCFKCFGECAQVKENSL